MPTFRNSSPRSAPLSRRGFLGLAAAAGLAAGCGREEDTATGPRTVTADGRFGPVRIPAEPRRVVAGYDTETDLALVLGLPLAGAPRARGSGRGAWPRYQPADRLTGVPGVQTYPEADYEAIAALRPDLILDQIGDEARYRALSAIAPTFDYSRAEETPDWRAWLRRVAAPFGGQAKAAAFVAAHDARAGRLRPQLLRRRRGDRVAYVNPIDGGQWVLAQAENLTLQTLVQDLGMTLADVVPATYAERPPPYSAERLDVLSGVDLIILRMNPDDGGTARDRELAAPLLTSPLWQRLPAVRAGAVVEVDGELFYHSPLAAAANLDWAERSLLR